VPNDSRDVTQNSDWVFPGGKELECRVSRSDPRSEVLPEENCVSYCFPLSGLGRSRSDSKGLTYRDFSLCHDARNMALKRIENPTQWVTKSFAVGAGAI
jgi:hypothetical protein